MLFLAKHHWELLVQCYKPDGSSKKATGQHPEAFLWPHAKG